MVACHISDTHGQHKKVVFERGGDFLFHTGDLGGRTSAGECMDFLQWFERQPFRHKVFIAGNHDFVLEHFIPKLSPSVYYLEDSGITLDGINIWGSPYTPEFYAWAFMKKRGEELKKHWEKIPEGLDVLLTHGPPVCGYLGKTEGSRPTEAGDQDLTDALLVKRPRYNLCGHIHEGYGQLELGKTRVINASLLDETYYMSNSPVYFEL